jgi:PAS domain S-box-containing protein
MGFKFGRTNNRFGNILDALRGLRLRLVLLVACGIVPLTLLVGDILESQRQEELEEARQSVQRLAHEAGHRQADLLSNVSNLLNVLASIPAVKNHDTDVCGAILADIFAHQRGLTSLWTARLDGSVACADDPAGLQFNMSTRQYFSDALKSGGLVVSNYTVGRLSGRPLLAMALPFKSDGMGADGNGYDGVVFAGVDIDWLYRLAEHRVSESEVALVLIDGEGTILAQSPPQPDTVGKRMPEHPLIRAMLASPEGEAELPDLHGIERIFAYVPLGSTGARLAIGIDRAATLESVDRQRLFSLAMLLLVATGSMIGAALAGEVLVLRWLDAVREAAARLGRGDLSVRAPLPPGGELRELAGAFNDMADSLEQRERSRIESEARFRDMAEVSSDWFWETGPDHRFVYMSQGIHMIGADSSHFIGKLREEIGAPTQTEDERDAWREFAATLRERRPFRNFIYRIQTADGRHHYVASSGKPLFEKDGSFAGYRGVGRDMTEAVETSRTITKAREQAEAANRAKSRFLAVMSHELRTPMTGVLGTIDLLGSTRLSAEQSQWLDIMRTSARTLMTVLNDILDFSKIEADQLKLESIDFPLQQVVVEVVRLFERSAQDKSVALVREMHGLEDRVVRGDPTRLRQVLLNLVGNAIKFTERGRITIRVTAKPSHGETLEVRFEVEDTGIGIGEDKRAHLFQAFSQADSTTTRRFGGTGLGLAICKRLVEGMGGRIELDSEPGKGSTFRFSVLLGCGGAAAPRDPPREIVAAVTSRRILLAEDNDLNRLLAVSMLKRMGHSVLAVENGVAAVAAAGSNRFDVGILDLHMPVMSGQEAAVRIKALEASGIGAPGGFPLIALTADAVPEPGGEGWIAEFDRWLTKPINWRELNEAIEQTIAKAERGARTEKGAPAAAS